MEDFREWVIRACDETASFDERHRAFGRVVRQFYDMTYGYARARLGDSHSADDVTQESLITAWLHLPTLRDPATFPVWLKRIVTTHCHRLIRRKRLSTVPLDHALEIGCVEFEPALIFERSRQGDDIREAIDTLGENERVAVTLFYIGEYSYNDIAEFLGVPLSTVKKRLHSARAHLRERITDMVKETLHQDRKGTVDSVLNIIRFFDALKSGDVTEAARMMNEDQALLNSTMTDGYGIASQSPLAAAIQSGKTGSVELLIARGANVGETDVRAAAAKGARDIVALLVAAGGIETTLAGIGKGTQDFFHAVHTGDANQIQALLKGQSNLAAARDSRGRTGLLISAGYGYVDIAKILLDNGADVNAVDHDNTCALQLARANSNWCHQGHPEMIELLASYGHPYDIFTVAGAGVLSLVKTLIEAEPDLINTENERGETPLECAVVGFAAGASAVIEYLMTKAPTMNIWMASQFCDAARVRQLLSENLELANAPRREGNNKRPLHYVAQNWRPQEMAVVVVDLLAEHGGDVNAVEEGFGWTPLHACAEWWNDTQIAEALLRHGANVNARSAQGWTPLHYSIALGRNEMAALLRERGGEE